MSCEGPSGGLGILSYLVMGEWSGVGWRELGQPLVDSDQ